MDLYMRHLRRHDKFKIGTSIARSFAFYDQCNYAIEQDISICVNGFGEGWIGVAWLDNGDPFAMGPDGLWSKSIKPAYTWKLRFNPIIQHRPRIALKTKNTSAKADLDPRFFQSVCQVSVHYGRFLSTSTAILDPFYAFSEIFTTVASSESQYLNMVERKIKSEIITVMRASKGEVSKDAEETEETSSTLSNLVYYKPFLDEHAQRLKENISSIEAQGDHKWPRVSDPKHQVDTVKQQEAATKSVTTLLKDFIYLLERARTLSESCDRGCRYCCK
ncbi:MAG: hypothetical protein Q9164_005386 [Protoblastenia rupestris]